MAQEKVWENEYKNKVLVTGYHEPQADVLRFFRFLKKEKSLDLTGLTILDLGSGTGRNANYLAQKGARVIGIEISRTALDTATKRAKDLPNQPDYIHQSMGEPWPIKSRSIDLVLDVLSSNSLTAAEREVYLSELKRVAKKEAYIFIKALCKDGDKNAANLLKQYSGTEKDTYVMPVIKLFERVFSVDDFRDTYRDFEFLNLKTKFSRIPFNGQIYNRKFIFAYLKYK